MEEKKEECTMDNSPTESEPIAETESAGESEPTAETESVEESEPIAETSCPYCRTKHRDSQEYRELMNRLKRIEGQIRGIQGMLQEDRYCVDILTQVSAVQSALNSFNKVLLASHIKTCVVEDIRNGEEGAVDELCATIQRLMK